MAVMDQHKLCINTMLSIPCFREAPVKVYHGEGWRKFISITLQLIHVLRMLQPLRHLPHSQWTYYCSYTISISLRGLPVNRSWCWSSPQWCAQHTAILWGKEPLNWPHNLHNLPWYNIVSKKIEGKRPSSSGNSLLIIKRRDDGSNYRIW